MTDTHLSELYRRHIEAFQQRYAAALDASGHDAAVIFAGSPHTVFADDQGYPFKAFAHFESWLPLNQNPWCSITVTPGRRPQLAYFQPDDYWELPPADPAGFWTEHFDIGVFRDPGELRALWPSGTGIAVIGEPTPGIDLAAAGDLNPAQLLRALDLGRTVKTPYEIACLREASDIGVRGHRAAAAAFADGASEYDIHLRYLAACECVDAELPYASIVGLNTHGAILHYGGREHAPPAERHTLLIDAGARCRGYASDITRTWTAQPSAFRDLVNALDRIQQAVCARLKPGVDYRDVNAWVHEQVAALLVEMGLLNCSPETALAEGITGTFLPHGLGHFLGVQVHDVAGQLANDGARIAPPDGHPFLRLTRVLETGNYLTVEPGIYFIDTLLDKLRATPAGRSVQWDAVDEMRPYGGVRIEDNVHITATGVENLTREAFA